MARQVGYRVNAEILALPKQALYIKNKEDPDIMVSEPKRPTKLFPLFLKDNGAYYKY